MANYKILLIILVYMVTDRNRGGVHGDRLVIPITATQEQHSETTISKGKENEEKGREREKDKEEESRKQWEEGEEKIGKEKRMSVWKCPINSGFRTR